MSTPGSLKKCPSCGTVFLSNREHRTYCSKDCAKKGTKARVKITGAAWRANTVQRQVWASAKRRAASRGIPFEITVEDIVLPTHCPVLGMELVRNNGSVCGGKNSYSLDRIVPALGYVKGNVQVISRMANAMKQDATPEQLHMFAMWILKDKHETFSDT